MRRSGSGGGGCITSLLPVAARAPPAPRTPASSPGRGGLPSGLENPPLATQQQQNPTSRPVTGEGGNHVPAGEAQWVPHAGRLPRGRCGRHGRGIREPPAAHEGDGSVPAEAAAAATWQPHAEQRRRRRQQRRLLWWRLRPLGRRRQQRGPAHCLAQHKPHAGRRECGRAHQPHGGHADEHVLDVHARHQPHARRRARGPREPPTAAAPAGAAGHRVVAFLVAHPPVDRRGERGPTRSPRPAPEEVPGAEPKLPGEEEPERPSLQSRYVLGAARRGGGDGGKGSRARAATAQGLRRCRGAGVAGGRGRGGAREVRPSLVRAIPAPPAPLPPRPSHSCLSRPYVGARPWRCSRKPCAWPDVLMINLGFWPPAGYCLPSLGGEAEWFVTSVTWLMLVWHISAAKYLSFTEQFQIWGI